MIPPPWTESEKQLARESCQKWAGTPHRNKIAVPGTGIDCIHFVFEVVSDAGILPRFKLPLYHGNLGVLRESNVMETLCREYSFAERVAAGEAPAFGDIAIFKCGEQSNHAGIVTDGGDVWHVPGKSAVGPADWKTVAKSLQCLMRFRARGLRQSIESLTWEKILKSV